jgi:large subunit ribosomal protein L31
MKKGIHPPYKKAIIACVCGNTFETRSTVGGVIKVEICSKLSSVLYRKTETR